MNRFVFIISFLLLLSSVRGQNQTRHSVDSLIRLLNKNTSDTAHISALLKLAEFQILNADENKAYLDSAAEYIAQAENLNVKVKSDPINGRILLVKSSLLRKKGQNDDGKALAEKAVQVLSQNNDKYLLGQAYYELSKYYDYTDPKQLTIKIKLIEKEAAAYQLTGNALLKAAAFGYLGDLYTLNNENTKAIEVLQQSLAAYKAAHYIKVHSIYILFARAYFSLGDYKQSLSYGLAALHTAESVKDSTMQLCEINNTVGQILLALDQRENAIVYFKNALQIAERYNDASNSSTVLWNIVKNYIRLNKPEEGVKLLMHFPKKYLTSNDYGSTVVISSSFISVYNALQQYEKAKPYCDQVIDIINHHQISDEILDLSYTVLVRYYFDSGQYSLARKFLIKSTNLVNKINEPGMVQSNNLQWFKLDSAEGNFKSANQHLLKYNKIKDSLFDETKSNQIQQIQIQFETERKENQIRLKDKDIRLLTQENKTANLIRNLTMAGIFLLIIIVGLLYKQFRNKQHTNMVIMHKNDLLERLLAEKDWLLKEVHHRVKNNLHTVICLLELQAANLESEALTAIENCQHRIYCMSLIHQKLYQSEEVKTIDMAVYLPEFINYLSESFGILQQIRFTLNIENLKLGVSQAIPIALIINEAVTNSIKYAFPGYKNGTITIRMAQRDDQITLVIADNGIGMPQDTIQTPTSTLGLNLIRGLCRDIKAQIEFENDRGTKITITFKNDQLNEISNFLNQPEKEAYS